jgi:hypothetical protein
MVLYKFYILFGVRGLSESQCTERIILKLSLHVSANPGHSLMNNLYIPEGRLGVVILDSVYIYIYIYIYKNNKFLSCHSLTAITVHEHMFVCTSAVCVAYYQ